MSDKIVKVRGRHGTKSLDITIPAELSKKFDINAGDLFKVKIIKDDDLYVKIENEAVKVKSLVAREMCPKYNSQQYSVVLKDGNPKNCDWYNIEIFTKQELGKKTGILAGKNKKVSINGKVYESVRAAAKELFVSYQTLLDYLSGKVNKSVIPKNIKIK